MASWILGSLYIAVEKFSDASLKSTPFISFFPLGECGGFSHHHDCSICLWTGGSTGDVPSTDIIAIPAGKVHCLVTVLLLVTCRSSFQHLLPGTKLTECITCLRTSLNCLCFYRVLVLYLGNLYSLIIALLDKVNSMSSAVSITTVEYWKYVFI